MVEIELIDERTRLRAEAARAVELATELHAANMRIDDLTAEIGVLQARIAELSDVPRPPDPVGCHLELTALDADQDCRACGVPARFHRNHRSAKSHG